MTSFLARRMDEPEPLEPNSPVGNEIQPQIEELASRLAEQGIQSTELVLDLVLHDLADQAREAVGASGAAIALEREGELVCRASAGSTAPDLGIRIHTESGLSGTCVKLGKTQVCRDTESDERVDPEACRHLGVRSIVVVPLHSADEIIGIFEVFAAKPQAFSAEHVRKLETLAASAVQTIQGARAKAGNLAQPRIEDETPESPMLSVDSIMAKATPVDPAVRILRWLVIGIAIPLLVLIGFDWGWHRVRPAQRPADEVSAQQLLQAAPQPESQPNPPTAPTAAAATTKAPGIPKPKVPDTVSRQGGLVIYQDGKVIYRETPKPGAKQFPAAGGVENIKSADAANQTLSLSQTEKSGTEEPSSTSLPPGTTGGRLLHSVRPQYPAEAILNKREGPVVLHGTVGEDGVIRDLRAVSGDPALTAAAEEAVQQWRYEPYRRNGALIAMPIDITIDFNLPK